MSFINVTISSVRTFRTVGVNAGPDTYTFCPTVVLLSGEAQGNPAGSTFRWEQILPYQYTISNRAAREVVVEGDLVSSSTSTRELVNFVVNESIVFTTQIDSMSFNGSETSIIVTDPIPIEIPTRGKLLHAGTATDSSFSWTAGQNSINAIITPIVTSDKQFRLWSNRGKAHQRYDDVDVILTPRDLLLGVSSSSSVGMVTPPSCRVPPVQIISDSPYTPYVCGSGGGVVVDAWAVRWAAPTCDTSLLEGYVVQQSCDGGDTWVTLAVTKVPYDVSVTTGCAVRIGAVYNTAGTFRSLNAPVHDAVDFVWTQPLYATGSNTSGVGVVAAFDSLCYPGSVSVVDPITAYEVTRLLLSTFDGGIDSTPPITPVYPTDHISDLTVTRLVLSYLDGTMDSATVAPHYNGANPISQFTVVGSGTIGG